jgi:hypothetical protein
VNFRSYEKLWVGDSRPLFNTHHPCSVNAHHPCRQNFDRKTRREEVLISRLICGCNIKINHIERVSGDMNCIQQTWPPKCGSLGAKATVFPEN